MGVTQGPGLVSIRTDDCRPNQITIWTMVVTHWDEGGCTLLNYSFSLFTNVEDYRSRKRRLRGRETRTNGVIPTVWVVGLGGPGVRHRRVSRSHLISIIHKRRRRHGRSEVGRSVNGVIPRTDLPSYVSCVPNLSLHWSPLFGSHRLVAETQKWH